MCKSWHVNLFAVRLCSASCGVQSAYALMKAHLPFQIHDHHTATEIGLLTLAVTLREEAKAWITDYCCTIALLPVNWQFQWKSKAKPVSFTMLSVQLSPLNFTVYIHTVCINTQDSFCNWNITKNPNVLVAEDLLLHNKKLYAINWSDYHHWEWCHFHRCWRVKKNEPSKMKMTVFHQQ